MPIEQCDRDAAKRWGTGPVYNMGHLAEAFAAHREAAEQRGREQERAAVVAWLRADNSLCDCFARSEDECVCGAWDNYKTRPLLQIAADIESGQHREGVPLPTARTPQAAQAPDQEPPASE